MDQAHNSEISSAEESRLVAACAFYLLVAEQHKHGVKKADLMKKVFKEQKKWYKTVMKKVELYLKEIAGSSLMELEAPKGVLMLHNTMKNSNMFAEHPKHEKMKMGLIITILSLIFMKEDFIVESDLWKSLKTIGVDPDSKHPVFGDLRKLIIHDLVRQLFLQYNRQENSDPPVFGFSWGPRAKLEVSKVEVLKFVCDVLGDGMTPQHWPDHYEEALKSEKEHVESQS